jgi:hypothetical protein
MMGELVEDRADIAAFPLTLTLDRARAVDMSYSFMNGGLGILVTAAADLSMPGQGCNRMQPCHRAQLRACAGSSC